MNRDAQVAACTCARLSGDPGSYPCPGAHHVSLLVRLDRLRHRIPFWWWLTYDALVALVIATGISPSEPAFWIGLAVLAVAVAIDAAEFAVKRPSGQQASVQVDYGDPVAWPVHPEFGAATFAASEPHEVVEGCLDCPHPDYCAGMGKCEIGSAKIAASANLNEDGLGRGLPRAADTGASGPAPSPDEASAETSRDVAWSHPSRGITGDLGGPLPKPSSAATTLVIGGPASDAADILLDGITMALQEFDTETLLAIADYRESVHEDGWMQTLIREYVEVWR